MYSQKYILDIELVLWVKQQIELLATNYFDSTHFCKYLKKQWLHKARIWCIRNQNISHVGPNTNAVVESFHNNMKNFFYYFEKGLWDIGWTSSSTMLLVMSYFTIGTGCNAKFWSMWETKKRRNCCHYPLANLWYSRYECPITPKWGGHYICGIHQPPKKNVDCTRSNFSMAIMPLPPWSTSHYLQACHEIFQDASSKHWWWFNC